jgi:hypothetical protein
MHVLLTNKLQSQVPAHNCTYTELSFSDMLSDSVRASELRDWSSLSCRDTGLYEE